MKLMLNIENMISGNIDLSTYDRIVKEILESIKQKTN